MKHSQRNEQPQQYNQRLLEEAYYQRASELRYYCLGRVCNEQLAEDIVQEAYSRAHEYLKENKHVQVENFRAFLYKFVHFILLEQKYKEGREVFIPEAKSGMEGEWVPDANNNPIDDLEDQIYREEVIAWALQGLTDREREHLAPHLVGLNINGTVEPLPVNKGRLPVQASQAKRVLGENIKARLLLDFCPCPGLKQALRQNWLKNSSNGIEAKNIRRTIKLINNHESKCPHCQKELNKFLLMLLKLLLIFWASFKLSASEVRAAFGWVVSKAQSIAITPIIAVTITSVLLFFTLVNDVGNGSMASSQQVTGTDAALISWVTATPAPGTPQTPLSYAMAVTPPPTIKLFSGITPFPPSAPTATMVSVVTSTSTVLVINTPIPQPTSLSTPQHASPPSAPPIVEKVPIIEFWADRVQVGANHCSTTLHWDVEHVRAVYLDGEGVVGRGHQDVCPQTTTTYQLQVVLVDGSVEMRYVTVEVVFSPTPTATSSPVIEPTDTPNSGNEPPPAPLIEKPAPLFPIPTAASTMEPTPVPIDTATPTATPTVTPSVTPTPETMILEIRVSNGDDDAEEMPSGEVLLSGENDLDLGQDERVVGIRFQEVMVPNGATINQAYLVFESQDPDDPPTNLVIAGQAADSPPAFMQCGKGCFDLSKREKTAAVVAWSEIPVWEKGTTYHTPDLAPIVQEIVNRDGWASDNSMVFIITGSGERDAWSHEGKANAAPLLHVEYDLP